MGTMFTIPESKREKIKPIDKYKYCAKCRFLGKCTICVYVLWYTETIERMPAEKMKMDVIESSALTIHDNGELEWRIVKNNVLGEE